MNLGDVRRLMVTISVASVLALLWLLVLGLTEAGTLDVGVAHTALGYIPLARWLWLGNVAALLFLTSATGMLFLVRQAPSTFARGIARQVQCQDCNAVFMIHDTGYRPVTHICPNCKALGVYDGTAPPVGLPPRPKPPARIIDLGLACQTCQHHFNVTDTGARPLRVKCPRCRSQGIIR